VHALTARTFMSATPPSSLPPKLEERRPRDFRDTT
jgi:hypothetical protein